MRRRDFITLLGGSAAWPLAARAQQAKAATIGLLGTGSAAAQSQWTAAFVQRMRELGWVEGRNLAIEYRWAALEARGAGAMIRSRMHKDPGIERHSPPWLLQLRRIVSGGSQFDCRP